MNSILEDYKQPISKKINMEHGSIGPDVHIKHRPRRLRKSLAVRELVQENWLKATDFVQPIFIIEGAGYPEKIDSLPGIMRWPLDKVLIECEQIIKAGIRSIALFPCIEPSLKDPLGIEALRPNNLVVRAIQTIKRNFPELVIVADVALDPYTSHGHDGIWDGIANDIDNDKTVMQLVKMACLLGEMGADIVAPSDMMDGRVGAIRHGLDKNGLIQVGILAYAAKYASAYYGPFRNAVGSQKRICLDKKTYQMNPANSQEALREAFLDIDEGADMIMVKPAGLYLDIIKNIKQHVCLPVVAYQVSGEYAQIHAASQLGWLDLGRCMEESLMAIKRAGADIIITYFGKDMANFLKR